MFMKYWSTAQTVSNGGDIQLQGDANGNLKIVIAGSTTGTSAAQVQGSVASGATDSGNPIKVGGVYNTSAPTLTNGQRGDMQLDAGGKQLVVSTGNVASGATDSGNPLKVGGKYNSSPITLTDGQRGDIQLTSSGYLGISIMNSAALGSTISSTAANSDGASANVFGLDVTSRNFVYNGTNWDRMAGNANAMSTLPGLTSTSWIYTSGTSPILSNTTTAVTIKASAGGSLRNYIDSIQLTTTAFTASVPIAIRDGAGGTVLWALTVPTGGFLQPATISFPMPLKGTAATLLEVLTTTANTAGTVTLSVQGHTGI